MVFTDEKMKGSAFNNVYLPAGDNEGWPRFESKQGNLHRAVFLLQRAARLDRTTLGALRWKKFRKYNQQNNPLARPSKRGRTPRDSGFDI